MATLQKIIAEKFLAKLAESKDVDTEMIDEVQEDFSKFYRAINEDDESKFTAKLTPSEGKLDLEVNFYERGLFPPGALTTARAIRMVWVSVFIFAALKIRADVKHLS